MLDRISEPEKPERPTAREVLIGMLVAHELDKDTAARCAEAIIDSLYEHDYALTYLNKAHHIEHAICDCGCGTVGIVFCDEGDRPFAVGQLFPESMIRFCNEVIETSRGMLPGNSASP